MSFMDKANEMIGQHDDKVDQAIDKVGDAAKEKYGHDGIVDKATDFARERTGDGDSSAQDQAPGMPGDPGAPPPAGEAPPPPPEGHQPPPPPHQ